MSSFDHNGRPAPEPKRLRRGGDFLDCAIVASGDVAPSAPQPADAADDISIMYNQPWTGNPPFLLDAASDMRLMKMFGPPSTTFWVVKLCE